MQKQKNNIKQSIIKTARKEFFKHGFKETSMRTIANKANVSLSNIYNYFKNKDVILQEILSPLLATIENMFDKHSIEENISLKVFSSKDYQTKKINMMIDLVENYRAELKLLLFQAHGSSFENYIDRFNVQHTEASIKYHSLMKKKYPKKINSNISEFFLHTTGSWFLSTIGEVVTHDELTQKELEQFFLELIVFTTGGWERIMKV